MIGSLLFHWGRKHPPGPPFGAPHARRWGVWGHYYGANLGDELVTSTIIHHIREARPDAYVHGFSLDPADTRARHGIPASPINVRHAVGARRRGEARPRGWRRIARGIMRRTVSLAHEPGHLWASYRALGRIDALVIAGSGQLTDAWGGPWGHAWTIFKWSLLAKIRGLELIFLSVGGGPLNGRLARFFIRRSLEMADYVSVREVHSERLLRDIGVTRPIMRRPDTSFALATTPVPTTPSTTTPPEPRPEGARRVVGINAMPHESAAYWGRGDEARHRAYVRTMADFSARVLDAGYEVCLFSSQIVSDPPTSDAILAELGLTPDGDDRIRKARIATVDDLLEVIRGCDFVVASRFHCVAIPVRMGIPTVGLAYHQKTADLMAALGLPEYCLDLDTLTLDELWDRFARLEDHEHEVRATLAPAVERLHDSAVEQLDLLFGTPGVAVDATAEARDSEARDHAGVAHR